MSFSEVRAMGGSIGPAVGMNTAGLGHMPSDAADEVESTAPSTNGSPMFTGFQAASSGYPPVSPNIASMWGIGGFTSPSLPTPPAVTPNTIASTLGNPQMPAVTYFNTRAPMGFNRMSGSHLGTPFVYKRKPDDELEEIKPAPKQHITEEKMSAHLNALHLSESYCNHKLGKKNGREDVECDDVDDGDEGLGKESEEEKDAINSPVRLVIADEVKNIVPGESKLPASLLKKLTQPSMAVVLWQPPGDVYRNILSPTASFSSDGKEGTTSKPHESTASPGSSGSSESGSAGSSTSSSPDSGVSLSSPPPSLSFLTRDSSVASPFGSSGDDDLLSFPSTSSGSRGGFLPPLRRPASPLPDPMAEDDFSERMEFNNNNGNAPNFMWLEENNNTALIDLNAVTPQASAATPLDDLPDLPDTDDMDL